jgi:hypothetical protein
MSFSVAAVNKRVGAPEKCSPDTRTGDPLVLTPVKLRGSIPEVEWNLLLHIAGPNSQTSVPLAISKPNTPAAATSKSSI